MDCSFEDLVAMLAFLHGAGHVRTGVSPPTPPMAPDPPSAAPPPPPPPPAPPRLARTSTPGPPGPPPASAVPTIHTTPRPNQPQQTPGKTASAADAIAAAAARRIASRRQTQDDCEEDQDAPPPLQTSPSSTPRSQQPAEVDTLPACTPPSSTPGTTTCTPRPPRPPPLLNISRVGSMTPPPPPPPGPPPPAAFQHGQRSVSTPNLSKPTPRTPLPPPPPPPPVFPGVARAPSATPSQAATPCTPPPPPPPPFGARSGAGTPGPPPPPPPPPPAFGGRTPPPPPPPPAFGGRTPPPPPPPPTFGGRTPPPPPPPPGARTPAPTPAFSAGGRTPLCTPGPAAANRAVWIPMEDVPPPEGVRLRPFHGIKPSTKGIWDVTPEDLPVFLLQYVPKEGGPPRDVDMPLLDAWFSAKPQSSTLKQRASESEPGTVTKKEVTFVESQKEANNILIQLHGKGSKGRVDAQWLTDALTAMDLTRMNEDLLNKVCAVVAKNQDAIQQVVAHIDAQPEDEPVLGDADKYLLALGRVSFVLQRVEVMKSLHRLSEEIDVKLSALKKFEATCQQLRVSAGWRVLLRHLLRAVNEQNRPKRVRGFKVECLHLFYEFLSNNKQTTFLDFIVERIMRFDSQPVEEVLRMKHDLMEAREVDLKEMKNDIERMEKDLGQVASLLECFAQQSQKASSRDVSGTDTDPGPSQSIVLSVSKVTLVDSLTATHKQWQAQLNTLRQALASAGELLVDVGRWHDESVGPSWDGRQFLTHISKFVDQLDKSYLLILALDEQVALEAQRRAAGTPLSRCASRSQRQSFRERDTEEDAGGPDSLLPTPSPRPQSTPPSFRQPQCSTPGDNDTSLQADQGPTLQPVRLRPSDSYTGSQDGGDSHQGCRQGVAEGEQCAAAAGVRSPLSGTPMRLVVGRGPETPLSGESSQRRMTGSDSDEEPGRGGVRPRLLLADLSRLATPTVTAAHTTQPDTAAAADMDTQACQTIEGMRRAGCGEAKSVAVSRQASGSCPGLCPGAASWSSDGSALVQEEGVAVVRGLAGQDDPVPSTPLPKVWCQHMEVLERLTSEQVQAWVADVNSASTTRGTPLILWSTRSKEDTLQQLQQLQGLGLQVTPEVLVTHAGAEVWKVAEGEWQRCSQWLSPTQDITGPSLCDPGHWSDVLECVVKESGHVGLEVTGGFYYGSVSCAGMGEAAVREEAARIQEGMSAHGLGFTVNTGVHTAACPVLGTAATSGQVTEGCAAEAQGAEHGYSIWVVSAQATLQALCSKVLGVNAEEAWAPEAWR